MRSQPVIPFTAAEQVAALSRMAPELATKSNQLPDEILKVTADQLRESMAARLGAFHRALQQVAAEEGVPLRIVEAHPAMPSPNPLAMPLAIATSRLRTLQWNVTRSLIFAAVTFAYITYVSVLHHAWAITLPAATMALVCLPLIVMSHQASCREVR